jgi:hypothetical protein
MRKEGARILSLRLLCAFAFAFRSGNRLCFTLLATVAIHATAFASSLP